MTLRRAIGAGVAAVAFAVLLVRGADHGDAPGVRINSRLDINDVYAFQAPGNAGHTVLIMTVSPLAGITGATTFHPQGKYLLKVDTNFDAVEDITFRITFSNPDDRGVQRVRLKEIGGIDDDDEDEDGNGNGNNGVEATGRTGENIVVSGGGTLRAGRFDDPFFFDLLAFRNGLAFCPGGVGTNFFRGLDTLAIVLELPSTHFGTSHDRCLGAHVAGRQDDRSDGTTGDQHRLHPQRPEGRLQRDEAGQRLAALRRDRDQRTGVARRRRSRGARAFPAAGHPHGRHLRIRAGSRTDVVWRTT